MILEFGFSNFFSFKEEAHISFRLDANCPTSISEGKNFATVMGVKGANGSGKTQVLKALSFISMFGTDSFSLKPDELIGLESFYNSKEVSEFFVEFQGPSSVYRYEIELTEREVKRETIYRTNKKKIKLIERLGTSITYRTTALKQFDALKLRRNASIVSTANQYEIPGLKDVYTFLNRIYSNVNYAGLRDRVNMSSISKYLGQNPEVLKFVKDFISSCDAGISDVTISSAKGKDDEEIHFPIFEHAVGNAKHPLTDIAESSGTKALFKWLPLYYISLKVGGISVIDEIDMNLHPHILPKILDLFLDEKSNPKNAQILFATHDTELLEKLGRYRTYLVGKEENESFVYRLDEIPGDLLRNDRPIRPVYNSGRLGGVPRI